MILVILLTTWRLRTLIPQQKRAEWASDMRDAISPSGLSLGLLQFLFLLDIAADRGQVDIVMCPATAVIGDESGSEYSVKGTG